MPYRQYLTEHFTPTTVESSCASILLRREIDFSYRSSTAAAFAHSQIKQLRKVSKSASLWSASDGPTSRQKRAIGSGIRHSGCVNTVQFSEDGNTLTTGSDDLAVKLWDISNPRQSKLITSVQTRHASNIFCAAQCRHNTCQVLSCAIDGTLRLSNIVSGNVQSADTVLLESSGIM